MKVSKTNIFFNLFGIVCLLLSVNHAVHFVSPLIRISQTPELPTDGNDITPLQFIDIAQYYQSYDWTEYDKDDFEDWLYMPETYPASLNQSENEGIPPFFGYDWDHYDPTDFPNWLDMPGSLPADFDADNATYIEDFIFENMDEDFKAELESTFNAEENPITMVISPFIFIYEMIWGLIFFAVAIILLIIGRSFQ